MIARLAQWLNHRKNRWLAKKQGLDFFHGCVFDHQLPYGVLAHGKIVETPMRSGRMAIYKVLCVDRWYMGGTGQHDWQFEFQGYMPNEEADK
jgi:hypothetical protein